VGIVSRRFALVIALVLAAGVVLLINFRSREAGKIVTEKEVPLSAPLSHPEVPEESLPEESRARSTVVIVLDDFGYSKKNLDALKEVDASITVAVLPNTPYAGAVCSFARENGTEVILHLPMEPEGETPYLEEDTISCAMDEGLVKDIIANDFRSVPAAIGVSNHMGSKATKDAHLMELVLEDLKERDAFFLDSFTTEESVCEDIARELEVPYVRRDIFIDNRSDGEYIKGQLKELERIASVKGKALGIGHDRSLTISILKEVVPGMKERGIYFASLSEIINYRE